MHDSRWEQRLALCRDHLRHGRLSLPTNSLNQPFPLFTWQRARRAQPERGLWGCDFITEIQIEREIGVYQGHHQRVDKSLTHSECVKPGLDGAVSHSVQCVVRIYELFMCGGRMPQTGGKSHTLLIKGTKVKMFMHKCISLSCREFKTQRWREDTVRPHYLLMTTSDVMGTDRPTSYLHKQNRSIIRLTPAAATTTQSGTYLLLTCTKPPTTHKHRFFFYYK